jgi:hypothetical protein
MIFMFDLGDIPDGMPYPMIQLFGAQLVPALIGNG